MKKILFVLIAVLIGVTSMQLWITKDRTQQEKELEKEETQTQAQPQAEAKIGGAFTLVNQAGNTVHDSDFRGRVMLVFFGFTHCPDICPVTVSVLSKTMELLGEHANQVAPLFVSVDPERDTPQALKEFLSNFDQRITGLTGTQAQIAQAAEAYKAYYAKTAVTAEDASPVDAPTPVKESEYTVDHSGYIYMMGKQGQFIRVFPYNVSEQELANAVETALK